MRLSFEQVEVIRQETRHFFGSGAEVWLFGSRVAAGKLLEILNHVKSFAARYVAE